MKNVVFWNLTPRGCCQNRRFGGTYCLHQQGDKNRRARNNCSSLLRLLFNVNLVPSSPILVILMMKAIYSSESSVYTRSTRPYTSKNGILHSRRRENLKSFITLTGLVLKRSNMFPVRYELVFYIPEAGIHHNKPRENLKISWHFRCRTVRLGP
jgi:hypothetical protein